MMSHDCLVTSSLDLAQDIIFLGKKPTIYVRFRDSPVTTTRPKLQHMTSYFSYITIIYITFALDQHSGLL